MNCLSDTPVNQSIRPCQLGVTLRNCSESFEPLDRILPLVRGEALLEIHPAVHGLSSQPILFWRGHTPLSSPDDRSLNTVVYYSEPALEAVRPDYRYRSPPVHQRAPPHLRQDHRPGSSDRHYVLPLCRPPTRPFDRRPVLRSHSAKPVFRSQSGCGVAEPGHGMLRNFKAELQQFAMDSGRSPDWILPCHALTELAKFRSELGACQRFAEKQRSV